MKKRAYTQSDIILSWPPLYKRKNRGVAQQHILADVIVLMMVVIVKICKETQYPIIQKVKSNEGFI